MKRGFFAAIWCSAAVLMAVQDWMGLARWQAWEASDWVVRPWWVEAAFAVLLFLLCIDWDRALSAFMTADTRPTDPTVTNVTLSVVPPLPGRRTIITYQSGQTIVSSEQT